MLKKSLALLLTLVMVLSLAPISAFAAETTGYDTVQIPTTFPSDKTGITIDGNITNGDAYHAYGVIANKTVTDYTTNKNKAMKNVGEALLGAQIYTYFFCTRYSPAFSIAFFASGISIFLTNLSISSPCVPHPKIRFMPFCWSPAYGQAK